MLYEIKDIYDYNKEEHIEMLSGFVSSVDPENSFWMPYRANYQKFDKMFMKKYRSWFPMDQEGSLADIAEEFAEDVENWLTINDKRYTELYRMQVIEDDEKYSLTDNVYEHEVIDRDTTSSGSNVKGSETITDTARNQYGQQSDSENKSLSRGQQSDSESISKSFGAATKTVESATSAANESEYSNTDRNVESDAARTDGETNSYTHGSRSDSETNSYTHGSRSDSETNSYTHGSHTDDLTNTRVDGQRTDTSTGSGTEDVERTRSGNIGVRTVDEMLNIHKDMWVDFSFYEMIFAEIARELLRGC